MIVHEYSRPGTRAPQLPVPNDSMVRAEGVHLSQIVHDLSQTLDPSRFAGQPAAEQEELSTLDTVPIVWLGRAFEDRLEQALDVQGADDPDYGVLGMRPGESRYLGVYLNADRLSFNEPARWPGEWSELARAGGPVLSSASDPSTAPVVVEEHKLTKMSGRSAAELADPKFRHWLWQLMFYCAAYRTNRGRIRAYFVNGDYAFGKTPATEPAGWNYRVWDLVFMAQELSDNTAMLLGHARRRGWVV